MIDHDEVEVTEPDSITADLASAWDAAETDDGTEQQGSEIYESNGESSGSSASGGRGTGEPSIGEESNQEGFRQGQEASEGQQQVTEQNEVAPLGLSPESREAWKDVPDAVKADITKRENDYAAGIHKHRANSERAIAMDRSLQPFSQLFAMNGGAGQTLPALLQTASQLQMGSAPQKAQAVAQIIKQFGVDIKTLDSMLVGEAPSPEVQQKSQMEQMFNQRLAPMQQQLQHYQRRDQQMAQQAQGQIASEVNNFGSQNEFYNDVRSDMADLLDMAANRGRQMSMQEAYNTACAAHPQISKVMSGRQAQQSVQQKKQAASSIHGTSGGSMSGTQAGSVAAALNDAWDSAGRM